jgi:hypothetical protein
MDRSISHCITEQVEVTLAVYISIIEWKQMDSESSISGQPVSATHKYL